MYLGLNRCFPEAFQKFQDHQHGVTIYQNLTSQFFYMYTKILWLWVWVYYIYSMHFYSDRFFQEPQNSTGPVWHSLFPLHTLDIEEPLNPTNMIKVLVTIIHLQVLLPIKIGYLLLTNCHLTLSGDSTNQTVHYIISFPFSQNSWLP